MRRRLEPCKHHKAGGFARARGPQHGEELTSADGQVQILNDERFAIIRFLNAIKDDETVVFLLAGQKTPLTSLSDFICFLLLIKANTIETGISTGIWTINERLLRHEPIHPESDMMFRGAHRRFAHCCTVRSANERNHSEFVVRPIPLLTIT